MDRQDNGQIFYIEILEVAKLACWLHMITATY